MILKVKDRYFIDSILDKKEKHTNTDSTTLTIYQEDRDYSIIKM